MSAEIRWIHHASFRLAGGEAVVYIDPWKLPAAAADATAVFISHDHYDHCSPPDVAKVATADTVVVAPADAAGKFAGARVLAPGEKTIVGEAEIEAVAAYNVGKAFHPKANGWLGAVVSLGGVRIYYAGDTDRIAEMGELGAIDAALLPVGGTYTMDAAEAAAACADIGCKLAVPYHWGDIVGSESDARAFASSVGGCDARVLQPGESLTI